MIAQPSDVLSFWRAAGPAKWFTKEPAFDADIQARFLETYEAAASGKLAAWQRTPDEALALVIVLDQFPRNMFRGDAKSYSADGLARVVAGRAIARGYDRQVPPDNRQFLYLPFEHSENLADQDRCCALFRFIGDAEHLKWADLHADIIRRFGRFPHRNDVLGRATTLQERAFLDGDGFKG